MDPTHAWLHQLGLERYVQVFAENDIDLHVIQLLGESDLEKLGVSLGHRKRLLKAIDELNNEIRGALPPAGVRVRRNTSVISAAPTVANSEAGERRQLTVLFCDMVGFHRTGESS
jgi:hypothetical protein